MKIHHLPKLCHVAMFLITAAASLATTELKAAEEVHITGTYELQVSCHDTHHEELFMIIVPGKNKFSGVPYVLDISNELRKDLKLGDKITVLGKRQPAIKKMMTRGQVRKEMVKVIKDRQGLPMRCKEMGEIMGKIVMKPAAGEAAGAVEHQHGELTLQPVEDDAERVEVYIPAHVVVESVLIIK